MDSGLLSMSTMCRRSAISSNGGQVGLVDGSVKEVTLHEATPRLVVQRMEARWICHNP